MTYSKLAGFTLPLSCAAIAILLYLHGCAAKPDCPVCAPAPTATTPDVKPTGGAQITATDAENRSAFEKIYKDADWGKNERGIGNSGTGSTLQATELYRKYLETFMKEHNVKTVVDAGCGDWEFSQKIDWTGIDYKGYDIVPAVIEADKKAFTKPNIQFFVGNMVEDDLPPADLLISKHVIQHLPNALVKKFLDKQVKKYKHVLLTDGVNAQYLSGLNTDIKPGEYREIDITRPPFNVPALKELTYWANDYMHQVVHIDNTKK